MRNVETLARGDADAMAKHLHKQLPDAAEVAVEPLLMFLSTRAVVHAEASPIPAFHAKKAKEAIRRLPKRAALTEAQLQRLSDRLGLTAR
jgi:hypothetical protein